MMSARLKRQRLIVPSTKMKILHEVIKTELPYNFVNGDSLTTSIEVAINQIENTIGSLYNEKNGHKLYLETRIYIVADAP